MKKKFNFSAMKYFLQNEVKTLQESEIEAWCADNAGVRVGIQTAKSAFSTGKELCDLIGKAPAKVNASILADSDRCCLDWAGIMHAQSTCVIKRSFSCPLLGVTRSKMIERSPPAWQYIPECSLALETPQTNAPNQETASLRARAIYLAVDIFYAPRYQEIKAQIAGTVGQEVRDWEYGLHAPDSVVLVVSDNIGFIEYFSENYAFIRIPRESLRTREEIVKAIEGKAPSLEQERTKKIVAKMACAEHLRGLERIGVVYTSSGYEGLADTVSKYLDLHRKKFYHIFVNGLKPNKLENIVGVQAFVVIDCPFSSIRFDHTAEIYRPYDLLLAFCSTWNGFYSTNLEVAEKELQAALKTGKEECDEDNAPVAQNGVNFLRLKKGDLCLREHTLQFFQTGEYLTNLIGLAVEEKPQEENDELLEGYSGIPTDYAKKQENE
ncbi:uncharacterized protein NEMAJ01_0630 [Nematocida major]|uniref:uncharacterized protein n=1 Tax=Nematocida major TaxID=1912982 RepID=UPI0020082AB6|nr:uncharacterized protein NEMAJ01_0630 [Nematocida major]KAH9385734.1 hypothetical protein NEMAJ01_0630 [Nematocida major]